LKGLAELARRDRVDLVLVGPEAPLVAGWSINSGPRRSRLWTERAGRRHRGSKVFSKTLMRDRGVPTRLRCLRHPEEARGRLGGLFPKVIKADGLAAGKGSSSPHPRGSERAISEIMEQRRFGAAGDQVLIEAFAEGEEVSAFAVARGTEFRLLPLSQDHKRIGEGDTGPTPVGWAPTLPIRGRRIPCCKRSGGDLCSVLGALAAMERPFTASSTRPDGLPRAPFGAGVQLRFGDPETQAVVPLLGRGFPEALLAVATVRAPP